MKLLVLCPDPIDPTSYFRAMGPLATLAKQYPEVELITGGTSTDQFLWPRLRQCDALFVQRPSVPGHLEVITQAKDWGVPVWIDYDDDLLAIEKDNPCFKTYSDPQVRQTIPACIELADVVTVTTPHLQSAMSELNRDVRVIPNAFDDPVFLKSRIERGSRQKYVVWRGSKTHVKDLMEAADSILELSDEHPDWIWIFMGYDAFFITDKMKPGRFGVSESATICRYLKSLNSLNHAIQIVPLSDSPFNRSKSNIAWIEGSWAGAATLAPDWEEWRRPGVTNYHGQEEFKSKLSEMMSGNVPIAHLNHESWRFIEKNLFLSHVNLQRLDLIRSFCM